LSSLFFIFSSDGISVTTQLKLCVFCNSCKKNNGGNYIVYRYICHLLNNPATVWHIRATIVEFQCHPTLIFATCWQIPSIFLRQNCHLLNNRATEWHSMPLYIYFCHRVAYPCHHCEISMPKRWHINATLLLFLPPIEIGGKIFLCLHRLSQ